MLIDRRMNDFSVAFHTAFTLIGSFDAELRGIVFLSLAVSLTASACAFAIGAPLGTALAVYRFPGRGALIVVVNALLGLPPVVVALRAVWIVRHFIYACRNGRCAVHPWLADRDCSRSSARSGTLACLR